MVAKSQNIKKINKAKEDLSFSAKKSFEKMQTEWQAVASARFLADDHEEIFLSEQIAKSHHEEEKKSPENKNFDGQDLSNKNFSYQDLAGASFKNCNLSGTDFSHAILKEANFTGANLSGVTLTEADIQDAILLNIQIDAIGIDELQALIEYLAQYYPHKLNLTLLNLTLLNLRNIDLSKINLKGVDFTGCDMTGVNIMELDLSECIISPEQIAQALGRPPTALELHRLLTPRTQPIKFNSKFAEQMLKLFQDDGSVWGVWDATKDKGVAIDDLMKLGKKVFKSLAGKPEPKLEEIRVNVQEKIEIKEKSHNQEMKKIIEERKREALEQMHKEEPLKEQEIQKQNIAQKEIINQRIISMKGRERDF